VMHFCNPNYLGDCDLGITVLGQPEWQTVLETPSYSIAEHGVLFLSSQWQKRKTWGLRSRLAFKKVTPYVQNNQSRKGWRHGWSGSSEFKPQYLQKRRPLTRPHLLNVPLTLSTTLGPTWTFGKGHLRFKL
jgi:hypothetical protein